MPFKNTPHAYGLVAKTLHWLMAVSFVGMIAVGWRLEDLPPTDLKWTLLSLHKSFGVTLLVLAAVRLLWKAVNVHLVPPASMTKRDVMIANAVHVLLYGVMFVIPLSGWMMSSAAGYPVSFFGLFDLFPLLPPNPDLARLLSSAHSLLAWVLIVTTALHAAAALYHHFIRRDDVLLRMLPFVKITPPAEDTP